MFEKNLTLGYLLDFYGEVLSEQQRSVMNSYYNEDLSLSEIAEMRGISRQGVRHIIKKCEEELTALEGKLGMAEQFLRMKEDREKLLDTLCSAEVALDSGEFEQAKKRLAAAKELTNSFN